MKKILKLTVIMVCLMLCAVFALTACSGRQKPKTCKEYLAQLVTAISFTVKNNNKVVLIYSNDRFYWCSEYEGKYDEYYLYPDKDNKKWAYNKDFKDDKWTKMAMSDADYGEYLVMIKRSLGIEEGVMDIVENISLNFDSFMLASGDKFTLKNKAVNYVDSLEMWVESDTLMANLKGEYLGNNKLEVYNLNSTVLTLTAEASAAKIGEISLP